MDTYLIRTPEGDPKAVEEELDAAPWEVQALVQWFAEGAEDAAELVGQFGGEFDGPEAEAGAL